jgi:hypothetical protein
VTFRDEHAGKKAKCRERDTSFRIRVAAGSDVVAASHPQDALPLPISAASSKPYAFFCPDCDADLEMKRSAIGTTTTCPACTETIRVPRPGERSRATHSEPEYDSSGSKLTVGDWLVCIFLPCVGIIAGFVRLVTGKANGGAMLGYSMLFIVLWSAAKVGFAALSSK